MLSNSFKWKHYEGEIILLNVRWYLKYPLSYRNLKEMMIERGIKVDHSTIMGSVAKIIFLQFDTMIFTFMCHFLPN
jgi:transposase-like protein